MTHTPRTYAWSVGQGDDLTVISGSLQDYANDLKQADWTGETVSATLWNGVDFDTPKITQSDFDEEDWAYVTIIVRINALGDEDVATYRIDGRS